MLGIYYINEIYEIDFYFVVKINRNIIQTIASESLALLGTNKKLTKDFELFI